MDGPSTRRSNSLQQCNSGSPSNQGSKSFKEVLAERNKQAQRRFRQRQKVLHQSQASIHLNRHVSVMMKQITRCRDRRHCMWLHA